MARRIHAVVWYASSVPLGACACGKNTCMEVKNAVFTIYYCSRLWGVKSGHGSLTPPARRALSVLYEQILPPQASRHAVQLWAVIALTYPSPRACQTCPHPWPIRGPSNSHAPNLDPQLDHSSEQPLPAGGYRTCNGLKSALVTAQLEHADSRRALVRPGHARTSIAASSLLVLRI